MDPDKKLKEALNLKDALVFECTDMSLKVHKDAKGKSQLQVTYHGQDAVQVHQFWPLNTPRQKQQFHDQFVRPHLADKHRPTDAHLSNRAYTIPT
ncbi:helicase-like protein [Vibrio cholerae]|nr:helicase-like protein [Vibrio cholerae]